MPPAAPTALVSDSTRTTVHCSDNLPILAALAPGSVDLVYLDPPFNTGRAQRRGAHAYDDTFSSIDAYLDFMRPRLEAIHRALAPTGSILVHCDWRTSHHLRLMLDQIFGAEHFVNHLIWTYGLGGSSPRRFARKHDDILFYGRTSEYWFDPPRVPATSRRMQGQLKKCPDVLDIPALNNMAAERCGYPTQKPLALLELLVRACCPPNGLVVDPFCGSGTTVVAAARCGRRGVGVDCSEDAVAVASERIGGL